MQKKLLVLAFTLVVALLVGLLYTLLQQQNAPSQTALLPLPIDKIEALLRVNTAASQPDHIALTKQLTDAFVGADFYSLARKIFDILPHDVAANEPLYFLLASDGERACLLANTLLNSEAANDSMMLFLKKNQKVANNTKAGNASDYELQFNTKAYFVHIGLSHLLIAENPRALEKLKALLHDAANSPGRADLQKLVATADPSAPMNLLVRRPLLAPLLEGDYRAEVQAAQSANNGLMVLDLRSKDKQLFLSGLASGATWAAGRQLQAVQAVLPENCRSFWQQSIDSLPLWLEQQATGPDSSLVFDFWLPMLTQEYALAEIPVAQDAQALHRVALLRLRPEARLREQLFQFFQDNRLNEEKWNITHHDQHFAVFRVPTKLALGLVRPQQEASNLLIMDNWAILGSAKALETIAMQLAAHRTLADNTDFQQFAIPQLGISSVRHYRQGTLPRNTAPNEVAKALAAVLANSDQLLLHWEQRGALDYLGIAAEKRNQKQQARLPRWSAPLDTVALQPAHWFTNHYSKNLEAVVQDAANTLYLIDENGQVLWKRPLEERIKSKVFEIDFFRNGKLQLLFNTTNRIYMIDRLGRDVAPYPIDLPYPATNPLAVFDYERDGNYRIVLACLNKELYAYTKEGQPVEGWEKFRTEGEVSQAVQHVVVDGKDFLVLNDTERVYFLHRRGGERVKPKQAFRPSPNNLFRLEQNPAENKPYLVGTDVAGDLHRVYFDGTVRKQPLKGFSANHFFLYQDLNGDGLKDYLLYDNRQLVAYNQLLEPIFDYKFKEQLFDAPQLISLGGQQKAIAAFSRREELCYLIGTDGSLLRGFPVLASGPALMGKMVPGSSHFDILVAQPNASFACYAY